MEDTKIYKTSVTEKEMEIAKKNDFVEIKYSGYANGELFDSNIEEDLKKLDQKAQAEKVIIVVGQGMVVKGFDKEIEGKEIGKEYNIKIRPKDGFGERNKELVKTMPLSLFIEKKINPYPGQVFSFDGLLGKIVAVSGARVVTDFNNPLAGKEIEYKFKIVRKVNDEKEKAEALFKVMFKFVPNFEIKDSIIVKGEELVGEFVKVFGKKIEELIGKKVKFELVEKNKSSENKAQEKIKNENNNTYKDTAL